MRLRRYFWQEVKVPRSFVFRAQSDLQFMNLMPYLNLPMYFSRGVLIKIEINRIQ